MKKIAVFATLIIAAFMFSACGNENTTVSSDDVTNPATASGDYDPEKQPKIEFETLTHNYGTIKEGDHVKFTFKFKNTGKGNLIISDASASCGCTVPEFTEEPVKPGDSGEVRVDFNSANKGADIEVFKTVTVITNTTPNKTVLTLRGFIKK
jgi:hypothetical protein